MVSKYDSKLPIGFVNEKKATGNNIKLEKLSKAGTIWPRGPNIYHQNSIEFGVPLALIFVPVNMGFPMIMMCSLLD